MHLKPVPIEFHVLCFTSKLIRLLYTCKNPPSHCVAFTSWPTLNFLNRNRSTQSRGAPRKLRNRYKQDSGRPRFWLVTSGEETSS